MAEKSALFRAYCEVCKGHVSAQPGQATEGGNSVDQQGLLTECGHIICAECAQDGQCAKCNRVVKQMPFEKLGAAFRMNLDPNLMGPLTFQNQFCNRFTNELVQAYKELEQKYLDVVEENTRLTAQGRDWHNGKLSADEQRRVMSRGASARLGSHSGDMGGHSMGPPIPMSPVVSGAHSGAQGTPRHSNIIISPKIITSGDMSSTRKVSSRAASPGGHGPQLIQHLSPANRNRIVGPTSGKYIGSGMPSSTPSLQLQKRSSMPAPVPPYSEQRGTIQHTPQGRKTPKTNSAAQVQSRFGGTAPSTPNASGFSRLASTSRVSASAQSSPFGARPGMDQRGAWNGQSGTSTAVGSKRATQQSSFQGAKKMQVQGPPSIQKHPRQ